MIPASLKDATKVELSDVKPLNMKNGRVGFEWEDSPDQNPEEPVPLLEREAAPRSQRHLELLAKQEILQIRSFRPQTADRIVPVINARNSNTAAG